MKYIIRQDRNKTVIFPVSMEASIDQDYEVRVIDLFVDSVDIATMGFKTEFNENGCPAYHPKEFPAGFSYFPQKSLYLVET